MCGETAQSTPVKSSFESLREIVESAAAPFISLAAEKSISLFTQLSDYPIPLSVDRPRLEMAIGNLLDNAIKFTPEGGQVHLILESDVGQISLLVRDIGEGIPPKGLPHIFERFYRGRGHSMEDSGLGLAIVKSVIEAHGGTVTVESTPGQGTTFSLVWESFNPDPVT